ncbi:hypothetical protein JCM15765_07080 [Paradesulfitobacterium aromaticivorans]
MNEINPRLTVNYTQVAVGTLLEISNIINMEGSFETVLEYVIDVMKNMVGATGAGLVLYDQEKKSLVLQEPAFGVSDRNLISLYQVSMDDGGNAVNVFKTKTPYWSNDVQEDPIIIQRLAKAFKLRNIVTVPVSTVHECYGVFHVINKPTGFTEEDVSLIKLLVSQIAATLRNAWQLNEIKNQELESRALLQLRNWTLGDVAELLNNALIQMCKVVKEADAVAIGVEGRARLVIGKTQPEITEPIIKDPEFWSKLVSAGYATHPKLVELSPKANLIAVEQWARRHGYLYSMSIPIRSEDKLWGMIWVWRKQEVNLDPRQLRFLSLVAGHLAMALHNRSLFEKEKATAKELKRIFSLHERLSKVLTDETGIEGITQQLAGYLGLPVIFGTKTGHQRVVVPFDDSYANQFDLLGEVQKYLKSNKQAVNQKGPVRVTAQIGGISLPAILAPIKSGREILGFLGILEKGRILDKLDWLAVEKAVTYYALELMKSNISFEVEQNLKVEFISSLLKGEISSPSEVGQRAASFGLDPSVPYIIVIFDINFLSGAERDHPNDEQRTFRFKRRLLREITNYLDVYRQGTAAINMGSQMIVVIPGTGAKPSEEYIDRKLATDLAGLLKTKYRLLVSVGVSTPAQNIMEFAKAFREAEMCINYLNKTAKQGQIMFYRDMGIYKLLVNLDLDITQEFIKDLLGGLLTVEEDKKIELLKTIEVYLDNECNLKNSAAILHIHPNTLRYRISQIEHLTGLNLVSLNDRANVHLAIRLMNLIT